MEQNITRKMNKCLEFKIRYSTSILCIFVGNIGNIL